VSTAIAAPSSRGSHPKAGRARRRVRQREVLLAYGLLLPSVVIYGTFVFYPFARNIYLSLHATPPFPGLPSRYVGLSQYHQVLTSASFVNSLWVTVLFVLYTVPVGIALGLLLAILAHRQLRGSRLFRTIFSSPVATSVAVASVIFYTLLDPQVGLFSYWLGLQNQPSILNSPTWALVAVSVVTVWQNLGLSFILMSAGLQAVPDELLEAASVDGASAWSTFWHITLPLLSPTTYFVLLTSTFAAFQVFDQVAVMTAGGPVDATTVFNFYIYQQAFGLFRAGYAAAAATVLFLILLLLTLLQTRVSQRWVHYQ